MSDTTTAPGDQSAREIEQEVDRKRDDLSASVEAIQDRFSVETIVNNVVRSFSENGGEVSRNLGRTLRENPVPVIVTGVGLAWLMASSNRPSPPTHVDADRHDDGASLAGQPAMRLRREDRTGFDTSDGTPQGTASPPPPGHAGPTGAAAVSSGSTPSTSSTGGRMQDGIDGWKASAGNLSRQAGDSMDGARRSVASAGGDISARIETFVEEQPLIVAALGFASGLGIGGLLPRTRTEDDLLGAQSDGMKDSARQAVSDQTDKAAAVAGAVVDEAKVMSDEAADSVDKNTPEGGDMVDQAKSQMTSAAGRLKEAGAKEARKQERSGGSA